jgi:hypothetical protein
MFVKIADTKEVIQSQDGFLLLLFPQLRRLRTLATWHQEFLEFAAHEFRNRRAGFGYIAQEMLAN